MIRPERPVRPLRSSLIPLTMIGSSASTLLLYQPSDAMIGSLAPSPDTERSVVCSPPPPDAGQVWPPHTISVWSTSSGVERGPSQIVAFAPATEGFAAALIWAAVVMPEQSTQPPGRDSQSVGASSRVVPPANTS